MGNDTIHVFTGSGAEWSQVQFTQATDHQGGISLTITGVTGFGGFAVGTKSAQQHVKSVNPPPAGKSDQQKQAGPSDSSTLRRHLRRHLRRRRHLADTYAHAHSATHTYAYAYAYAYAYPYAYAYGYAAVNGHAHAGTDAHA